MPLSPGWPSSFPSSSAPEAPLTPPGGAAMTVICPPCAKACFLLNSRLTEWSAAS